MKLDTLRKLQFDDGSFGPFHSMSSNGAMTTERALRRFYYLNLTSDHEIVRKTLKYVSECLDRDTIIPDRREMAIHWDAFCDLMFSSWLFLFSCHSSKVKEVRLQWISILEQSIVNGTFDKKKYSEVYRYYIKQLNSWERVINPASFYVVVLVKDGLSEAAKKSYLDYMMQQGIYYIYDKPLNRLPEKFGTKTSFEYLEAIRLVLPYTKDKEELLFIKEWIDKQIYQIDEVMLYIKADGMMFPRLSENWRKKKSKQDDIASYLMGFSKILA